ncbi:hypothetical protein KM043_014581 [Ampulex compressa]|nr:hypothetical protein KM043_014581 [Ampulex compressa]
MSLLNVVGSTQIDTSLNNRDFDSASIVRTLDKSRHNPDYNRRIENRLDFLSANPSPTLPFGQSGSDDATKFMNRLAAILLGSIILCIGPIVARMEEEWRGLNRSTAVKIENARDEV